LPFTPYHFGPALCLGIPLRKYIHLPTLILANVVLDIEPMLVLFFGLDYPLHGYLHTLVAALGVGIGLGFVMFLLEKPLNPVYTRLLLEPKVELNKSQFIVAGILGTMLHVLFDAPLYWEIKPFYPLTLNPLYGLLTLSEVYFLCFWMVVLGIIFYSILLITAFYKDNKKAGN
jgi:membrane-bound metal-dependent hydrolase YbcI (DUF457 family)